MEYRKNAGYSIQEEVSILGKTYVLGCNPATPAMFVTWQQLHSSDGAPYYWQGHYFSDEYAARQDLLQRAISDMSQERSDALALAVLSEDGRSELFRQARDADAWSDIENCFYSAADYLDLSDRATQKILNDPEFKEAALRAYWNQDHSYENEALQESLEILIRDQFAEALIPSHEELFEDIAGQLYNIISSGEAATFIDVCAEQRLPQKDYMLVVWGEENDQDDMFYSVAIQRVDKDGNPDEQIMSEFSESKSFEDLKVTVMDVLQRFEENVLAKEPEKESQLRKPLDDIIQSAESRQGREGVAGMSPEQEPSL